MSRVSHFTSRNTTTNGQIAIGSVIASPVQPSHIYHDSFSNTSQSRGQTVTSGLGEESNVVGSGISNLFKLVTKRNNILK